MWDGESLATDDDDVGSRRQRRDRNPGQRRNMSFGPGMFYLYMILRRTT